MAELDFDFSGIKNLQKNLQTLAQSGNLEGAMNAIVNKMGAVYLREAKKKTPVGPRSIQMLVGHDSKGNPKYETHYFDTQNMRRSWFMDKPFFHNGNSRNRLTLSVKVFNTSRYASYVDDGHRQKVGQFLPFIGTGWQGGKVHGGRLKKSWVDGLDITLHAKNVVENNANNIMNSGFNAWLRSVLNNG
ncbi:HK97 gp10 family phage protein [Veillonella sp. VA137]|uniref:HK97 gp10 family phage protein n=1 Tax=Veillonella sp. VA137 TaxID=741828 RepID=UPI0013DEC13E|nr:HK97 gp10 family phage protein [Veillonella sp. VA137]